MPPKVMPPPHTETSQARERARDNKKLAGDFTFSALNPHVFAMPTSPSFIFVKDMHYSLGLKFWMDGSLTATPPLATWRRV